MKYINLIILLLFANTLVFSNELDWQETLDVNLNDDNKIYFSNMDDNYLYLYSLNGIFFKIDKSNFQIVRTENFDFNIVGAYKLNDRLYVTLLDQSNNTVYYKSSDDNGEEWNDYSPNFNTSISPLILDGFVANENEIYLCGMNLLQRAFWGYSNDGGANYVSTVFNESQVNFKIFKDVSTNTLLMGSSSGLYTSSDNGNNWQKHDYFDASNSGAIRTLNYHNNILFATDDKSNVFRSFDIGKTWVKSTLPEIGNSWFVDISKYDNYLLMHGTNSSNKKAIMYFSYNNGSTWSKLFEMDGIARNAFIMNDSIYVVVSNGKIFKSWLQPLSISEPFPSKENGIRIHPNPATDYITIQTSVGFKTSEVSDNKIFNMLGECVITTPSAAHTPLQEGNLRIDVSHLPTGVYYIRVGNQTQMFVKV